MAILRGFPPSNTISPSVRISEVDLTLISPTTTFHRIGIIGFASKGPINTPTSVTSLTDLATKFGNPHPDQGDPYLIYAAQQALRVSSDVVIVRVADVDPTSGTQATSAEIEIPAAGGVVDIIGATIGTFVFANDGYFSWRLNGITASKVLVVPAATYTITELVTELNDQLTPQIDGIEFYETGTSTLGIRSVWAYGTSSSIELVSIQDSIYGGAGSIVGIGTSMTVAELLGTADRYPDDIYTAAGDWNFSGVSSTILSTALQVVVNGTGNINIDNVVQVIDLSALSGGTYTTGQVVSEINTQIGSLPGGFLAVAVGDFIQLESLAYGRDSRFLVKPDSTLDVIFGLENTQNAGSSPTEVSGGGATDTAGIITGSANSGGTTKTFTVYADSPGIEGNNTSVIFTNNQDDGTFTLKVFNNGASVESWGNLSKNQDSSFYAPTYVNSNSYFVRIVDNTAVSAPPANTPATGLALVGGTDGIPLDPDSQDDLVIGNPIAGTGLYNLSEPEQIDIDLICAPGRSSTSVIQALISVAENYREDCLAIIDPPFGLTVREIIEWQNGVHPLNGDRFDTDFAALYWPWLQITDVYNNIPVWVPPSGSVLAAICNSDNLSAVWFAPAGLNRGVVQNVANVYSRPTLAERDQMYGNQNCINPIISYPDVAGFVIWGQKTLQRAPTALDRVNVRRMLFYVEKAIKNVARTLLFEPNTEALRATFVSACTSILSDVQQRQGLTDFVVKCDAELNTPDVIDRNELRARIGLVPTRAAEFIFIEFSLNRTGTNLG